MQLIRGDWLAIDHLLLPDSNKTVVTIHDADDYSNYVEEGEERYDMISIKRWERMHGRPPSITWKMINEGNCFGCYITFSSVWNARLERCFLFDVQVNSCTLHNCQVHFSIHVELSNCAFYDCVLTTESSPGASVVFTNGMYLYNCTLKGNFAQDEGRSDLQTVAKDPIATWAVPYEVHNNIVFRDCVVDCLRRWIWRYQNKQQGSRFERHAPKPQWKGKTAGKRPMHVNTTYDVMEQLDLPVRRCDWSVQYTEPERLSPPRKRKIDMTWMNLDD